MKKDDPRDDEIYVEQIFQKGHPHQRGNVS